MTGPPRTTAEWVRAALEVERATRQTYVRHGRVFLGSAADLQDDELRAPLKETIISTGHRTMRVHSQGERVILGPRGEKIKVVEMPEGGNQIEHGDHLHAAIRPEAVRATIGDRS